MAGPFIFIATNRLKTGKVEAEGRRVPGLVDFIGANEPRLIAFNEYVNDEGTEVAVVQVHPDADSFESHMGVVRERASQAYQETFGCDHEHPGLRNPDCGNPRDVESLSRQRSSLHDHATSSGRIYTFSRRVSQRGEMYASHTKWHQHNGGAERVVYRGGVRGCGCGAGRRITA